jgi:predicted dithiol-disulfide oxidoreductase (DUF899 family)
MSEIKHKVVSREEWEEHRAELLKKEKELTKAHDALAPETRALQEGTCAEVSGCHTVRAWNFQDSVFFYREGEDVYQTYFTSARGLETVNAIYSVLDLLPIPRLGSRDITNIKSHTELLINMRRTLSNYLAICGQQYSRRRKTILVRGG